MDSPPGLRSAMPYPIHSSAFDATRETSCTEAFGNPSTGLVVYFDAPTPHAEKTRGAIRKTVRKTIGLLLPGRSEDLFRNTEDLFINIPVAP
jgi:hypothetical protein